MSWLSKEAENELKIELLTTFSDFLENYNKPQPRLTGLISQSQLIKELGIKYNTLIRWEDAGLKRYTPPIEDTRKVFYKVSDILIFLGVNV